MKCNTSLAKNGKMTYQKDSKFIPISVRNVGDYTVLGTDDKGMVYLVSEHSTFGFIFNQSDLMSGNQHAVPIAHVQLRDTKFGYKQAHNLRIRESYAKLGSVSQWYTLYVEKFGGVVCDNEHLDGGKMLWQSFIKSSHKLTLANSNTGETIKQVDKSTDESELWATDSSIKDLVLIMEK